MSDTAILVLLEIDYYKSIGVRCIGIAEVQELIYDVRLMLGSLYSVSIPSIVILVTILWLFMSKRDTIYVF
jgi:hypothetical protein